jgi:hypothetical protein
VVLRGLRGYVDRLLATVPFLVPLPAFSSLLRLWLRGDHRLHGVIILRTRVVGGLFLIGLVVTDNGVGSGNLGCLPKWLLLGIHFHLFLQSAILGFQDSQDIPNVRPSFNDMEILVVQFSHEETAG